MDNSVNAFNQLCSGIFWVITETMDISEYKLLAFEIPCDSQGNAVGGHKVPLNAKSGNSYNHKKLWESEIKNMATHKPYGKQDYDYYPRGRVEVSNNRATIYLNPNINIDQTINNIKLHFGLTENNISCVRIVSDGSTHYKCFIDEFMKQETCI